ncbi:hypothetical protein EDF81_0017 [Enterobacter sp. BIGb0383]|uniref:hypothetical protein n=1 Tax=unclassified Enterobacter TaxID=2608935 RepID=UPI000F4922D5|nr:MULTISPECIES: hypothetical protein [unclassified Enterobacter]ROP61546.1 hypothetical protein EDF81_0017 [Enterobacter sp. BIGb0383]ROS11707.1 hypothetical protein EC848_0017 [Enterobacter sp. BIGb0359]
MKYPPLYPDYRVIIPPDKKRWGVAWLVGTVFCVFCTLWLWPADQPIHTFSFWFWIAIFPTLLTGLLFALRSMVYQVASGNQRAYRYILQQTEEEWWQQRSAGLPIEPWCLLGPGGDKPEYHLAALTENPPPPQPVIIGQGLPVLHCPQILENDISRREAALTRHLVRTLLDVYPLKSTLAPVFTTLYWCGAPEEGQRFIRALSEKGWQFQQPLLLLNDIDRLDDAIDHYYRLSGNKNNRILCAGIYCPQHEESTQIMGEAGFVWSVGTQGKVSVQRAERQDISDETAQLLLGRAEKLAQLTGPPEYCLSFNRSAAEYLQSGGWPTLKHIQEPFWGDLQRISPFIAMTLAAFQSLSIEQPCGWITQDIERKYITGVISVDKK